MYLSRGLCVSGYLLLSKKVTEKSADIDLKVMLSNTSDRDRDLTVRMSISDGTKTVLTKEKKVRLASGTRLTEETISFSIKNPHLWNARQDPFIYDASITLVESGKEIDRVNQPLGLRYFRFDADEGFSLNGKHLQLRGVCRHQ